MIYTSACPYFSENEFVNLGFSLICFCQCATLNVTTEHARNQKGLHSSFRILSLYFCISTQTPTSS